MTIISFNTANFVARPLGYNMTRGWSEGDRANQALFRPVETFGERFAAMLDEIQAMGFEAIDLWTAQLYPPWATRQHVSEAQRLLAQYSLPVVSLCGWFGDTADEFEGACRLAADLDCRILGGSTSMLEKDRAWVIGTLRRYGLRLALENHPEPSAEALRARMGPDDAEGTLGVTVDTGWFGTQGVDAAGAIRALGLQVLLVHLKDVRAAGAHDTCRYGQGVVPVEACVRALAGIGYEGTISVEHEPEHFDPRPDCVANLAMVREWLGQHPPQGIGHD
jgi:sugar phosphate isomerase/epimerase